MAHVPSDEFVLAMCLLFLALSTVLVLVSFSALNRRASSWAIFLVVAYFIVFCTVDHEPLVQSDTYSMYIFLATDIPGITAIIAAIWIGAHRNNAWQVVVFLIFALFTLRFPTNGTTASSSTAHIPAVNGTTV